MKLKTYLIGYSLVIFAFIAFSMQNLKAQSSGLIYIDSVQLGLSDGFIWNYSMHNDTIYLTNWTDDNLIRFSTLSKEAIAPVQLTGGSNIHGNYVDNDGIVWVFDLNGNQVIRYGTDFSYIDQISVGIPSSAGFTGSQPVNGIEVNGKLYVADRYFNKIYVVNMTTLNVESEFEVSALTDNAGGTADFYYYNSKLYMVSDEFSGILSMDLDGSNQEIIETNHPDFNNFNGIQIVDGRIYTTAFSSVFIYNMDGELLHECLLGENNRVADLLIKDDTIYLAKSTGSAMLMYRIQSSEAEFLSYTIPEASQVKMEDVGVMRVEITVPQGTDLSHLVPTFTVSAGATISNYHTNQVEESGVTVHDFTNIGVSYWITAEDGTKKQWNVIVVEDGLVYNAELTNYEIAGQVSSTIVNDYVFVKMPGEASLTGLTAEFDVSYGAIAVVYPDADSYDNGIMQISGETLNSYIDTLALTIVNHSQTNLMRYKVVVDNSPSSDADFLSYSVPGASNITMEDVGVMRVMVTVPQGTDLSNIVPSFSVSPGASVTNFTTGLSEESGVTVHDFSTWGVGYWITAEDGTKKMWNVVVLEEGLVYTNNVVSYEIHGQISSNINDEIISVTMPAATDLTNLIAEFELAYGAMAVIYPNNASYNDGQMQISGETINNFADTLVFTVVNHSQTDIKKYKVSVKNATSLKLDNANNPIYLYPNPASNQLTITINGDETIESLTIFNMKGVLVLSSVCKHVSHQTISIDNLPSGIYAVYIKTKKNLYYKPIIKQ